MGLSQDKSAGTVCAGPRKENICAIVVTYFPDTHIGERLDRIRGQVGKTISIDNTGDPYLGDVSPLMNSADIEIIRNKQNAGVGAALNQGVSSVMQLCYEWAITFDQDSWI